MEFRRVGEKNRILRPNVHKESLSPYPDRLIDELELRESLLDSNDLSKSSASGLRLVACVVRSGSLADSSFRALQVDSCVFDGADLSNTKLDSANVTRCEFRACRLIGFGAQAVKLRDVYFQDCRLDYADLRGIDADDSVAFVNCKFSEADLSEAQLPGVRFERCDFQRADLMGARARDADFRGSRLEDAIGITTLRGAIFTGRQLLEVLPALTQELGLDVRDE